MPMKTSFVCLLLAFAAADAPAQPKVAPPGKPEAPASHEKLADKEVARDAWRKNLPDVSAEPGKARPRSRSSRAAIIARGGTQR